MWCRVAELCLSVLKGVDYQTTIAKVIHGLLSETTLHVCLVVVVLSLTAKTSVCTYW